MSNPLLQFQENLKRARDLGDLAVSIGAMTTQAIDISDIWRAELVLAVSALDHFIHELARTGMVEIANGTRTKTDAYLRFRIPLAAAESALAGVPHDLWFTEAVREQHSWLSFQDPEKIADAIRLVSTAKLWDEVAAELGLPARDVKTRLKLVVERRNKIAHEADMDPANPGFRWPIAFSQVRDATDFIEIVGCAIHKVVG
jgi:hypothetical protein